MKVEVLLELLEAAGYTAGHAHLHGTPPGAVDCCLVVLARRDQLPPMSGIIEHLESEESDLNLPAVIDDIRKMMINFNMLPGPEGSVICFYLDIAMECRGKESFDAPIVLNSRGSGASN